MSIEPSQIDPKSGARPLIIAVIGGADPPPWAAALAEEVGRELAKRQVVVVCGGLTGVMAAVCRGAKAEGGTTIGILPGTDPNASSPHVDYPIMTGMGYARNVIVVKTGRAAIAIDGAYGTLSEIGHALGWMHCDQHGHIMISTSGRLGPDASGISYSEYLVWRNIIREVRSAEP